MSLPYAVDAEQPLQPAELAVLRDQYLRELNQGHASTQTKFNFAWGLVKSRKREDMAEGVALLTGGLLLLLKGMSFFFTNTFSLSSSI
jgi:mitochondrial fission 1 protein